MRLTELNNKLARARAECRQAIISRQRAQTSGQQQHWKQRVEGMHRRIADLELEIRNAEPTVEELRQRLVKLEADWRSRRQALRHAKTYAARTAWRAQANVLEREIAATRRAMIAKQNSQPATETSR